VLLFGAPSTLRSKKDLILFYSYIFMVHRSK